MGEQREPVPVGWELEAVLLAVLGAVLAAGCVVFGGARLAAMVAGGWVSSNPSAWFSAVLGLSGDPSDPAGAWGAGAGGLPGGGVYWACTGVVAVTAIALVAGLWWLWRWSRPGRVRFGVAGDARPARRGDVGPLVVGSSVPPVGRFLLGRMAPRGPLLATEDRDRHRLRGRAGRRQGSRGSVAVIGPTQAGKTVLLSSGIIGWDGPVVALSVKRDLFDVTAGARAGRGELAVFDPGGSTGLATARWTPLRGVTTASGALRAGRALAAAIPRNGMQGGDYWAQQGETFVSAYMAVAGLSHLLANADGTEREPLTIQQLTAWAFTGAGIREPTINELVRAGLKSEHLETSLLANDATMKLMALHNEDPRIRASIYATARLAFEAWAEPTVAHSASRDPRAHYHSDEIWERRPQFIDLDWLIGDPDDRRANTLYLVAPDTEFKRLAPVLGGLLGDLREQIHAWDVEGRRLAKPLLFVIDEAAQLELSWLPEEVSTIAGLGGMFVTCWQSKAQIDHRYGTLADAVMGGHRSKIVLNGCDDPSTLNWIGRIAGTEHVARRGWTRDSRGSRTVSENLQNEDLIGAHIVRQMLPGEGILIHGTLPPVHLRSVKWWTDRRLRDLVPTNNDGQPAPPETGTCPLTDEPASGADTGFDRSALRESTAKLPPSSKEPDDKRTLWARQASRAGGGARAGEASGAPGGNRAVRSRRGGARETPGQLALLDPAAGVQRNTVSTRCERCHRWLLPGQGITTKVGRSTRTRCHPSCQPTQ